MNKPIILILILLLCSLMTSGFTPQTDIDLRNYYQIVNGTNISATAFYQNDNICLDVSGLDGSNITSGTVLETYLPSSLYTISINGSKVDTGTISGDYINDTNLNVNSSSYWDNLNNPLDITALGNASYEYFTGTELNTTNLNAKLFNGVYHVKEYATSGTGTEADPYKGWEDSIQGFLNNSNVDIVFSGDWYSFTTSRLSTNGNQDVGLIIYNDTTLRGIGKTWITQIDNLNLSTLIVNQGYDSTQIKTYNNIIENLNFYGNFDNQAGYSGSDFEGGGLGLYFSENYIINNIYGEETGGYGLITYHGNHGFLDNIKAKNTKGADGHVIFFTGGVPIMEYNQIGSVTGINAKVVMYLEDNARHFTIDSVICDNSSSAISVASANNFQINSLESVNCGRTFDSSQNMFNFDIKSIKGTNSSYDTVNIQPYVDTVMNGHIGTIITDRAGLTSNPYSLRITTNVSNLVVDNIIAENVANGVLIGSNSENIIIHNILTSNVTTPFAQGTGNTNISAKSGELVLAGVPTADAANYTLIDAVDIRTTNLNTTIVNLPNDNGFIKALNSGGSLMNLINFDSGNNLNLWAQSGFVFKRYDGNVMSHWVIEQLGIRTIDYEMNSLGGNWTTVDYNHDVTLTSDLTIYKTDLSTNLNRSSYGVTGYDITMPETTDISFKSNGQIDAPSNWTNNQNYNAYCPDYSAVTGINDSNECTDWWININGDNITANSTFDFNNDSDLINVDFIEANEINASCCLSVGTIRAIDDNSIAIQPDGDYDDYITAKAPSDRPTFKREGGKFIYFESSNVYDVGISFRDDDTYSGTLNYEKDTHRMTMLGKNSPIGFKMNSDYDDYILFQTDVNNSVEITNVVTNMSSFKINAGGNNSLLLNHDGGNVSIGRGDARTRLDVNGTITADDLIGNLAGSNITSGTINFARLPTLTDTHTHNTLNLTNIAGLNNAITLQGENITGGTVAEARLPSTLYTIELNGSTIDTGTVDEDRIEDKFAKNYGDDLEGNYSFDNDTMFIDADGNTVGVHTTTPTSGAYMQIGTNADIPGVGLKILGFTDSDSESNFLIGDDSSVFWRLKRHTDNTFKTILSHSWNIYGANVGVGPTLPANGLSISGDRMIQLIANTTSLICNTTNAGGIYYDGDEFKHYGCNSTNWVAMY